MKKTILLLLFFQCCIYHGIIAQMWSEVQNDTLYGNEWIDFDVADRYFKIKVADDGIYRINQETLINSNIPVETIEGAQYQLFRMGEEQPIYVSSDNEVLGNGDYITFYGQKNRSELDRHLFKSPDEEMLNPKYSIFTDTAVYFLTWTEVGEGLRYETIENDLSGNLPDKEAWFIEETLLDYHNSFYKKYEKISNIDVYYSNFDVAEGFATTRSSNRTEHVSATQVHPTATHADLSIRLATNIGAHQLQIEVDGVNYIDSSFHEVRLLEFDLNVPISEGNPELEVLIKGMAGSADQHVLSNIHLHYQRQFNFGGQNAFVFSLPASVEDKYLEIENFDAGTARPILYDISNNIRLESTIGEGLVKILLPPSMTERQLILLNPTAAIRTINVLEQTIFEDYMTSEYEDTDYVLLSHQAFFDDGQGNNLVQAYADYRSSAQGGGYETAIIDIEQLYDQFGYGIYGHAISVRNFAHYIKKHWEAPHYFFIVGKGREYRDMRTPAQFEAAHNETFFVPTFGWPGSDNLLFSDNYSSVPMFSMGRLSCRNTEELGIYLRKVKVFEETVDLPQTIEDKEWMKHILHLGGGGSANEQALLKGHLEAIETTMEESKWGASVSSFYKTNSDPVQTAISEQIFDRLNKGVSIVTFLGHSAPSTLEFNIDNPDGYYNYGKYFLLMGLGCSAGNIYTAGHSISERFCFYEDKGAIAFASTRGFGFVSALRTLSERYYSLAGNEMYGESIGDVMRVTLDSLSSFNWIGMNTLRQQFTFQADPAIKFKTAPGPDYLIDETTVNFDPNVVSLSMDSFKLSFEVANIGFNVEETMAIELIQELPNGTRQTLKIDTITAPATRVQLNYTLPTLSKSSVGLNKFFIKIDKDNNIEELPNPSAELNNELVGTNGALGTRLYVVDDSATPLYPKDFGIVGTQTLELKASTADALAPERIYIIELDTTALFNSPLKNRTEIVQKGGLIKWTPNFDYQDETTYYWRISPDSLDVNIGYLWNTSSFTFVEDSQGGWNQGHYYQFLENPEGNIMLNEESREFEFIENVTHFRIKNLVNNLDNPPTGYMNNIRWSDFFRFYLAESLQIVVFDDLGRIWFNPSPGLYGSSTNVRIGCFSFPINTVEDRGNIINFIENIVPDNHTVFVYTAQRTVNHDLKVSEWEADSILLEGKNIFNMLEGHGATSIRTLQNGMVPYLFSFVKNGDVIGEEKAVDVNGVFNFEHSVKGFWHEGTLQSSLVGPAKNWEEMILNYDDILADEMDSIAVNVYGFSKNKENKTLLIENLIGKDTTLNFIDPIVYPYLQLEYYATDAENRSVPQLDFWRVMYEGLPDAAYNTDRHFVFRKDTLEQGEALDVSILIEPTQSIGMDSLLVKYWVVDEQGQEIIQYERLAPLSLTKELLAEIELETKNLAGRYQFWMQLNPDEDQSELYNFNNYLFKDFFVKKDGKNPLLDVTFDGMHIFNGDIVHPEPLIQISLKDENQFLLLQDTALFEISLRQANGVVKTIPMNSPSLQFMPASSATNNKATIDFNPVFEESGDYRLMVRAKDVANNLAGDLDYEVDFQVILEKMVSNVLNYPNPFSTSTRFVYTLTGDSPPDYMSIQILTVSGQVVRDIRQSELGELKIGRHQTDFAWDGTDEFGDQLANGIYLYRVVVKDENGEDYKKFDTSTDKFFENGFGKLVILR